MAQVITTTLQDIITLVHQQYGIRFQQNTQQLVNFANMIQYIAYNKDVDSFLEFEQRFTLGIEVFLETDPNTYTPPIEDDIGKQVSADVSGVLGTLINFTTRNRVNQWIIAPPDGVTGFTVGDSEVLTIVGGSTATGVAIVGQNFDVSSGPYRMPSAALGNPPFRKFVGVTQVTDKQMFQVPPNNGFNGVDDYGLLLNSLPGRNQNFPYRYDIQKQEVTLVSSTPPEITTSQQNFGPSGTVLNTSKLRWIYYKNCPPITDITDDSQIVLPERYRYEVIYKGITLLADVATYGEAGTIRELIEPVCERFWEDMRYQYQQYGRGSDYISEGDNWDYYGLGMQGPWGNGIYSRGQSWY